MCTWKMIATPNRIWALSSRINRHRSVASITIITTTTTCTTIWAEPLSARTPPVPCLRFSWRVGLCRRREEEEPAAGWVERQEEVALLPE